MRSFVYFGTPSVASETLATLIERGFTPALVVTAPDAPKGRGLSLTPSPVKELAAARGIPVITPDALDAETLAAIESARADFAVVVAYGKIFPGGLIDAFPLGVLNIHYSLLPKHRGATPLEAALLAGDHETGVTIQKMAVALDAGDVIAQRSVPIGPADTARDLRPRLIALGAELLSEILPAFARGELAGTPQGDSPTPYAHRLKKEDGLLSLSAPDKENWRKYRAYADSIGTHFFEGGMRVKIAKASFDNGRFRVERVIPEGKREMDYADFCRSRS